MSLIDKALKQAEKERNGNLPEKESIPFKGSQKNEARKLDKNRIIWRTGIVLLFIIGFFIFLKVTSTEKRQANNNTPLFSKKELLVPPVLEDHKEESITIKPRSKTNPTPHMLAQKNTINENHSPPKQIPKPAATNKAKTKRKSFQKKKNNDVFTLVTLQKVDKEKISNNQQAKIHYNLATRYLEEGQLQKAINELGKSILLNPDCPETYINLGAIYQKLEKYDQAIKAYKKASSLNPKKEKAHNNLGVVYSLKGDIKQAISEYEKAIVINPRNYASYINLGIVHKRTKSFKKAEYIFKKVISLNPPHPESHYNLALLYEKMGNINKAIVYYQNFLDLSRKDQEILKKRIQKHINTLISSSSLRNHGHPLPSSAAHGSKI